jgi:hypothetical protein
MSSPEPPLYLAACMTYSNHASYLAEWVEFHLLVGIERFFLYDNGSTDDHRDVLAPYIDEGVVVLHEWPGPSRRYAALDHCVSTYRDDARWIAFFDIDEFVFSPNGTPVPEVLKDYEPFSALGINSAVFLTSGHKARPPGLVIENYLMRRQLKGRAIKSIVDPRRTIRCVGGHNFVYSSGHAVDLTKKPVHGPRTEKFVREGEHILRMNHYFTKSEEELRDKWLAPRPDTKALRDPAELDRILETEADKHDEKILIYLPALKEALARREEQDRKITL